MFWKKWQWQYHTPDTHCELFFKQQQLNNYLNFSGRLEREKNIWHCHTFQEHFYFADIHVICTRKLDDDISKWRQFFLAVQRNGRLTGNVTLILATQHERVVQHQRLRVDWAIICQTDDEIVRSIWSPCCTNKQQITLVTSKQKISL